MTDPSIVELPNGVPPWSTQPRFGGESQQVVKGGGEFVIEFSQAAAVTGRDHGYLSRTLSTFAIAGCTCGWFVDGPASQVKAVFEQHTQEHP